MRKLADTRERRPLKHMMLALAFGAIALTAGACGDGGEEGGAMPPPEDTGGAPPAPPAN